MVGRRIDESNVDDYIEQLINRTKGQYINQGVAFNKKCKRQMALLRKALIESSSFSGLIKELLAIKFTESSTKQTDVKNEWTQNHSPEEKAEKDFSSWI